MTSSVAGEHKPRDVLRLLRFLKHGPARLSPAAKKSKIMLESADRRHVYPQALVSGLHRSGLILIKPSGEITLSEEGRNHLARKKPSGDDFAAQHRLLETIALNHEGERSTVTINAAESPLALMARRKDQNGSPFLVVAEIEAGEHFRSDFERGMLLPSVTSQWEGSHGSSQKRHGSGKGPELTEAALSARLRVETALEATGPQLSGALIDFLCFQKGLGQIESERSWPRRSAKLMLKAALGLLARHYEGKNKGSVRRQQDHHWGSDGYRPEISSLVG